MGNGRGESFVLCIVVSCSVLACVVSAVCSGLLYTRNPDWVHSLFSPPEPTLPPAVEEVSPMAGQWVCPDLPSGSAETTDFDTVVTATDKIWCRHPFSGSPAQTDPIVVNHHLASRLPKDAKVGEVFTATTLQGRGGVFGPATYPQSYGYNESERGAFTYTAPATVPAR